MLAIGEFSRLTHLSVRTLRRYHDADLLVPAVVDDATGYRYYRAGPDPDGPGHPPAARARRTAAGRPSHPATADPDARGRVHPVTLPVVELAVATHVGEHDDIDVTYGEVGAWVVANALAVAGPIRETYLVGPRDTADPSAWRTEIGWPVFRVASGRRA